MSGMIYAVIVVMWAAFLVPMWLRRHDDTAEARSVDRFASKMRVLARRTGPDVEVEPEVAPARRVGRAETVSSTVTVVSRDRRDTRTASASSAPRSAEPRTPAPAPRPGRARELWAESADRRAMAELAAPARSRDLARDRGRGEVPPSLAARRRRVLALLLATTLVVVVLGVLSIIPLWSSAIGWALVVGYLVHLRNQARRASEIARRRARAARVAGPAMDDRVVRVMARRPVESASADEAAVTVARPASSDEDERATEVPAATDDGWRPVSVPVPTYVTAPAAARSVRRIELGAGGAWTSGRLVSDAAAAGRAAAAAAHQEAVDAADDVRRAVGD